MERQVDKRPDTKLSIPVCPLMSAGSGMELLCKQEYCSWYIKSYKMCAIYLLGHNAALDIKSKQHK